MSNQITHGDHFEELSDFVVVYITGKMENFDVYGFAHSLRGVDMFPFFDIANSIKAAMLVRGSFGSRFEELATNHPITCWITTMLSQSAGGIISNLLLGNPSMAIFSDPYKLPIATIIWFIVFYSNFYDLFKFIPVALVYAAMAEVHRAKRILGGVTSAAEIYPSSYAVMILIGTIGGNGKDALKIMSALLNRLKSPQSADTVHMIPWTKFSLLAALLFTLTRLYTANEDAFTNVFPEIPAPHIMLDLVFMGVVLIFELFMLLNFINLTFDPFAPLGYLTRLILVPEPRFEKRKLD